METSIALRDPVAAHAALAKLWPNIKGELLAGHRLLIEVRPYEDVLTEKQRKYYHGFILKEIARTGARRAYSLAVWKEHFRSAFLGVKRKSCINPLTGRKSKRSVRVSTEDLGVKGYNVLIEKVTAFAVTELGVHFDLTLDEWIDHETGEIRGRS